MMPSLMNDSMSPKKTLQQPQATNAPQGQQVITIFFFADETFFL
jgi:hypothetical protein